MYVDTLEEFYKSPEGTRIKCELWYLPVEKPNDPNVLQLIDKLENYLFLNRFSYGINIILPISNNGKNLEDLGFQIKKEYILELKIKKPDPVDPIINAIFINQEGKMTFNLSDSKKLKEQFKRNIQFNIDKNRYYNIDISDKEREFLEKTIFSPDVLVDSFENFDKNKYATIECNVYDFDIKTAGLDTLINLDINIFNKCFVFELGNTDFMVAISLKDSEEVLKAFDFKLTPNKDYTKLKLTKYTSIYLDLDNVIRENGEVMLAEIDKNNVISTHTKFNAYQDTWLWEFYENKKYLIKAITKIQKDKKFYYFWEFSPGFNRNAFYPEEIKYVNTNDEFRKSSIGTRIKCELWFLKIDKLNDPGMIDLIDKIGNYFLASYPFNNIIELAIPINAENDKEVVKNLGFQKDNSALYLEKKDKNKYIVNDSQTIKFDSSKMLKRLKENISKNIKENQIFNLEIDNAERERIKNILSDSNNIVNNIDDFIKKNNAIIDVSFLMFGININGLNPLLNLNKNILDKCLVVILEKEYFVLAVYKNDIESVMNAFDNELSIIDKARIINYHFNEYLNVLYYDINNHIEAGMKDNETYVQIYDINVINKRWLNQVIDEIKKNKKFYWFNTFKHMDKYKDYNPENDKELYKKRIQLSTDLYFMLKVLISIIGIIVLSIVTFLIYVPIHVIIVIIMFMKGYKMWMLGPFAPWF